MMVQDASSLAVRQSTHFVLLVLVLLVGLSTAVLIVKEISYLLVENVLHLHAKSSFVLNVDKWETIKIV